MVIYDKPEEYAKVTHTTIEQARVICRHFKYIGSLVKEARKCPECGEESLGYDMGSHEGGYGAYIYCNTCEYDSEVKENYEPLITWYDFDIVLMMSLEIEEKGLEEVEKEIGTSWGDFVERSIRDNKENTDRIEKGEQKV